MRKSKVIRWINHYFLEDDGREISNSDYAWFYGEFYVTSIFAIAFIATFCFEHIKNLQAIGLQVG